MTTSNDIACAWLYSLMGEHDFTLPNKAFAALVHKIAEMPSEDRARQAPAPVEVSRLAEGLRETLIANLTVSIASMVGNSATWPEAAIEKQIELVFKLAERLHSGRQTKERKNA